MHKLFWHFPSFKFLQIRILVLNQLATMKKQLICVHTHAHTKNDPIYAQSEGHAGHSLVNIDVFRKLLIKR